MSDSSASSGERRLDAILADFLEAQRRGTAPGREELLAKHPEFAAELAAFLDDQAALAKLAPPAPPLPAADTVTVAPGDSQSGPPAPAPGVSLRYLGDYELLDELARGGMGIVFKARQTSLNRLVAVKMILAGQFASADDVKRFRAEAEAAAALDHPNILPIYEVGEHQGHQYFSMKLVEGGSLAQPLAQSPRVATRGLAALLVLVARAVHYAHQRGILHRDLKPANVLLDADGTPYVTDFGLARKIEGDSQLTQPGAVVGTPSYMAPEQAEGARLTTAADVYSLGAILYEVLTGRPPFKAATSLETLLMLRTEEPPRPRSLDPHVDRDLETVALKALDRDPARRYESAAALADDLQRWLDGLPILARPATPVERLRKWARRRPAVAALTAAVALIAALGVSGIVWQWRTAVAAGAAARAAEGVALDKAEAERIALEAEGVALAAAEAARRDEADAREQETRAKEDALKAGAEKEKARTAAVVAKNDADKAREQAEKDRDAKKAALVRADGLRLSAEADAARFRDPGLALLLAVEGVRRAPHHLTFSSLYAALNDCREERTLPDGGTAARYFPNGKRLLVANSTSLRVIDPATGKALSQWPGYNLPIGTVALSPDGSRAVVTGAGYAEMIHADGKTYRYTDRLAFVIDLAAGKEVLRLRGATSHLNRAEFSPDGKQILTSCDDGSARIHDAASGKLLHTLTGGDKSDFVGTFALLTARFSPDGKRVLSVTTNDSRFSGYGGFFDGEKVPLDPDYDPKAKPTGGGGRTFGGAGASMGATNTVARLWDAATGKQVGSCYQLPPSLFKVGHVWHPYAAAFSPDGKLLAVTFADGAATLFDGATGQTVRELNGHEGRVTAVAFSPDGRLVATSADDKTVRLWDTQTGREALRLRGHTALVTALTFDAAGKRLLSRAQDNTARVWEVPSGAEAAVLRGHTGEVVDAVFSPDGRHVATAGDTTVRLWSLDPPARPDITLTGHTNKVTALAYSPNGELAVTVSPDQTARLWDTKTGKPVRTLGEGRNLGEVKMAAFSRDGRRLITAAANRTSVAGDTKTTSAVVVWDVATGNELLALDKLETGATAAVFSPDGRQIVTVGDGTLRIKVTPAAGKPDKPGQVEVAPGVTIGIERGNLAETGIVQLWDAATGRLISTVRGRKNEGWSFGREAPLPQFLPDGKGLVVFDPDDRRVRLIEPTTGGILADMRPPGGGGGALLAASSDGRVALLANGHEVVFFDTATGLQLGRLHDFPAQVTGLAVSGDGRRLATAVGKTVYLWELATRKRLAVLSGHEAAINALALDEKGERLLTGSDDQTAGLWDTTTGRLLALYRGHTGKVTRVAFRPDGQQVATVGEDGTARLWPADLWPAVLARLPRPLTDAERERYELTAADGKPAVAAREPLADPPPGAPLPEPFALPAGPRDPAAEAKADAELAAVRARSAEEQRNGLVELRQTYPATGAAREAAQLLAQLPGPLAALEPAKVPAAERLPAQPKELVAVLGEHRRRHDINVDDVAISDSGRVIASHDAYNVVHLWDAATLAPKGQVYGALCGFVAGRDEVVVNPWRTVETWDVSGAEPRRKATSYMLSEHGWVHRVSPDGRFVAYGSESPALRLYDLKRRPEEAVDLLPGTNADQREIVFSPGSDRMAVTFTEKSKRLVFDLGATPPRRLEMAADGENWPFHPAFSPDGKRLAAARGQAVRVWDVSGGEAKLLYELTGFRRNPTRVVFSADDRTLYADDADNSLLAFDLTATPPRERARITLGSDPATFAVSRDGNLVVTGWGVTFRVYHADGDGFRERDPLRGPVGDVSALEFTGDDGMLAAADGSAVRLWAPEGGRMVERHSLPGGDGEMLLTPDGRGLIAGRRALTFWDLTGSEPRRRGASFPEPFLVGSQSLSADGKLLARADDAADVNLFDLGGPEPRPRASLQTKSNQWTDKVVSITVSPDGRFVAGASQDGGWPEPIPLRVWRVTETGLAPLAFPRVRTNRVAFTPDGKGLAAGSAGAIHLWDLAPRVPRERLVLKVSDNWDHPLFRFDATGLRLVSLTGRRVVVWDAATGKALYTWDWPLQCRSVAFAHDGKHLAVGNSNGTVYVLRLPGE
jgi:WD40 repeat protein